jgi:hypothetical protein
LLLVIAVSCVSFFQSHINLYPFTPTIKQTINILISSTPIYLILKINQFNIKRLFKIYLNVATIVCFIGILQQLSYILLGIEYKYGYKLTSIVSEPAHLAIVLAPAFFIAINKLLFKAKTQLLSYKKSILVIVTWFWTMSAVAMLGIILAAVILAINKFDIIGYRIKLKNILYIIILAVTLSTVIGIIYYNVSFIRFRVEDTWQAITADKGTKIKNVNLSTYALYSNFLVTKEVLKNNPAFGTGLGTHRLNYDKYLDKAYNFEDPSYRKIEFNKDDANSLFLRLISELGVAGLLLFLFFLHRMNIRKIADNFSEYNVEMWLINNGCLLFFLMRLIRFGNYTVLGFFLFLFIFYYSHKEYSENKSSKIKNTN